MLIVINKKKS